ncbi:MAG: helix-turn-helix domain-containing protein [Actinomycetota bacterium]
MADVTQPTGPAGTGGSITTAVPLSALADAVALDPDSARFAANPVTRVQAASDLASIEAAEAGDLVVLDPSLHRAVSGYRFDLAVGRAGDGVAAIVGGSPGATGRRVLANAGIALATLAPGHDVASLAVLLRDLSRGSQQAELAALERLVDATADCAGAADIDELLGHVERTLGRPTHLSRTPHDDRDRPIRVQGVIRWYLVVEGAAGSALLDSVLSHVARHIETVLQADFDARELPEATRSELINEILLSDVGTWADAAGRLRRAGFPLDGSHCAIRVDCQDPTASSATTSEAAVSTYRAQQRIAELLLEGARRVDGVWTRAGTATSVVLLSSRTTSHGELISRDVAEAATRAVDQARPALGSLELHVGVGTPHPGLPGLRTSVNEATTAVRSARDHRRPNQPQFFDRLGFGRALLQWAEIDGIRSVVDELLAPLLDQSPQRAAESLETLRTYLASGRNVSSTAATLHLHRNTIRYRIERITDRLAVDLDDPDERLLLELACRLVAAERPT